MASSAPASTHAKCTTCSSSHLWMGTCCKQAEMFCLCGHGHFRAAKACQSQSPLNALLPPTTFIMVMILLLTPESTTSVEKLTKSVAHLEANGKIKACKYVCHIHQCHHRRIRKVLPCYQVIVTIKESQVQVFPDTRADVSVMPLSMVTKLGLPLSKTKMCIKP